MVAIIIETKNLTNWNNIWEENYKQHPKNTMKHNYYETIHLICRIIPMRCFLCVTLRCECLKFTLSHLSLFSLSGTKMYKTSGNLVWWGRPSISQRFLRRISFWEITVHIRYCFCKIFLCLRPLNLRSLNVHVKNIL